MNFKRVLLYISVATFAVIGGFLLQGRLASDHLKPLVKNEPQISDGAQMILNASLQDLQGQSQSIAQWRGKVLIVNFWATWCEPCRREIPDFIELQDQFRDQGLLFIGIALDQKNQVITYSKEMGINYPVLLGGIEAMTLAEAAGNRQSVVPFTVIMNRDGKITSTHLGRVSRDKLESVFKLLL